MGVPIDRGLTRPWKSGNSIYGSVEMGVPIDRGLTQDGVFSNFYLVKL